MISVAGSFVLVVPSPLLLTLVTLVHEAFILTLSALIELLHIENEAV